MLTASMQEHFCFRYSPSAFSFTQIIRVHGLWEHPTILGFKSAQVQMPTQFYLLAYGAYRFLYHAQMGTTQYVSIWAISISTKPAKPQLTNWFSFPYYLLTSFPDFTVWYVWELVYYTLKLVWPTFGPERAFLTCHNRFIPSRPQPRDSITMWMKKMHRFKCVGPFASVYTTLFGAQLAFSCQQIATG